MGWFRNRLAGIGRGFGGLTSWSPDKIDNLILWSDPSHAPSITMWPQPTVVDGDMEAAGVAAWPEHSHCDRTKEPGALGLSGSQFLRLTVPPMYTFGIAKQSMFTTGLRYRTLGLCRGDGTNRPLCYTVGTGYSFVGTSSTTVQTFAQEVTEGNADLYLYSSGAATKSTDYDDMTAECLSVATVDDRKGGSSFAQASAAKAPWISDGSGVASGTTYTDVESTLDKKDGIRGDGSVDKWEHPSIGIAGDFTIICAGRFGASGSKEALLGIGAAAEGIYRNAGGNLEVDDGATTTTGAAIADDTMFVAMLRRAGGACAISVDDGTKTAGTFAVGVGALTQCMLGDGSAATDGRFGEIWIYDRALTDDEITELVEHMKGAW